MKFSLYTSLLSLLFVGTLPAAPAAFVIDDGPHLGLATGGDTEDPGIAWGWSIESRFNRWLSLEGGFTTFTDTVTPDVIAGLGLPNQRMDIDAHSLTLTGRLTLYENKRVRLTAGAGLGYHPFNHDSGELATTVRRLEQPTVLNDVHVDLHYGTGWHAAVDLEVFLTDRWELQLGVRQTSLDIETDVDLIRIRASDNALQTESFSGDLGYDHLLLRAGINYRF